MSSWSADICQSDKFQKVGIRISHGSFPYQVYGVQVQLLVYTDCTVLYCTVLQSISADQPLRPLASTPPVSRPLNKNFSRIFYIIFFERCFLFKYFKTKFISNSFNFNKYKIRSVFYQYFSRIFISSVSYSCWCLN